MDKQLTVRALREFLVHLESKHTPEVEEQLGKFEDIPIYVEWYQGLQELKFVGIGPSQVSYEMASCIMVRPDYES